MVIRRIISGLGAGRPYPLGGTAGQNLQKFSNADGDMAWADPPTVPTIPTYKTVSEFGSDFIETLGKTPYGTQGTGSGANPGAQASGSNYGGNSAGVLQFLTGSTAAGAGWLTLNQPTVTFGATGQKWTSWARIGIPVLPNGTDDFTVFSGFSTGSSVGTPPTSNTVYAFGVIASSAHANWRIMKNLAGTITYVDTLVPVTTNWIDVKVVVETNATPANAKTTVYLNDVNVGFVTGGNASNYSNYPLHINKIAGVTGVQADIDFARLKLELATSR